MRNFIFLILLFPLFISCGNLWEPSDYPADPKTDTNYQQVRYDGYSDIVTVYLYRVYQTEFGDTTESYKTFKDYRDRFIKLNEIGSRMTEGGDKLEYYKIEFKEPDFDLTDHRQIYYFFNKLFGYDLFFRKSVSFKERLIYREDKEPLAMLMGNELYIRR